ncbi:hypothetical protein [Maribacter sp. Asnod1-A12]|uniref:hypothetical protein n=1 Tax=Maribacter sp. Asnod1-A12 TaxID=3160576 RepID=UPI00386728FB
MKTVLKSVFFISLFVLVSCGNGKTNYAENAVSIKSLGDELQSEFGDAYYTSINVTSSDLGSVVTVTNTEDPSSMKMADWSYFQGSWKQNSDITLEVPEGAKAQDYMFQVGKQVKFDVLGKIVDDAKAKLKTDKKIDGKVQTILVNAPNDGNFESMEYYLTLEPMSGGTSFDFQYQMDGTLIKYDY